MNKITDLNDVICGQLQILSDHEYRQHKAFLFNSMSLDQIDKKQADEIIRVVGIRRLQRLDLHVRSVIGEDYGVAEQILLCTRTLQAMKPKQDFHLYNQKHQSSTLHLYNNLLAMSEGSTGAFVGALASLVCHHTGSNPSEASWYSVRAYTEVIWSSPAKKTEQEKAWIQEAKDLRLALSLTAQDNEFWT